MLVAMTTRVQKTSFKIKMFMVFHVCCHNSQLRDLVSRTVLLGESNSILVVGPRGCGKSVVIKFFTLLLD